MLQQSIEKKRAELMLKAKHYGFGAKETLTCSIELDELIIAYQENRLPGLRH
ncbi:aspartyl-phosphate phosphatase Spo0E family protein [Bacillus sp. H-16]|uniref:aspartyl-phosphate phosphatase Spo0E family protein n=1 Tax=Alteribacter salitolerans TaxID=2912333 RepID=UPI0019660368|nr:aspartyl-phosphate phosphatase Spo0E family protein [Alteribacter salitolerans]MBM7094566.1 aspartyl-phosphate phosphatase Spo0E family protein [Alteribacter salitolerans]